MTPTTVDVSKSDRNQVLEKQRVYCLASATVTLANQFINWSNQRKLTIDEKSMRVEEMSRHALVVEDGIRYSPKTPGLFSATSAKNRAVEFTLDLVHPAGSELLFLFSLNEIAHDPGKVESYCVGDLQHTIAQYRIKPEQLNLLQVATLSGSALVLARSTVTIREFTF